MFRLAAVTALALATPALAAEQSFPVGGFDHIALGGSPDVTVTTGRAVSVRASGEQKALDRLDIRVEGGVLKIGTKRGDWGWRDWGKVSIAVTVPMVRGVELGGSGTVSVDRVRAPAFAAEVGGSGTIRVAALDTQSASFSLAGSGSVEAAGHCGAGNASVTGSGRLRLAGLRCDTLTASITGSGDIDATATRTADVSVMGSGDARVGGGARCSVSKHGSGSVACGGSSVG